MTATAAAEAEPALVLDRIKDTRRYVRFADPTERVLGHLYLPKEQVAALGEPQQIRLIVEAVPE